MNWFLYYSDLRHEKFNDGGEFWKSYNESYLKDLVLKLEQSESHATFLNLNITT